MQTINVGSSPHEKSTEEIKKAIRQHNFRLGYRNDKPIE
jgi:hypothetical protein